MRRSGPPKRRTPEEVAGSLSAHERIALFCAANSIHPLVARIPTRTMEGFVARDPVQRGFAGASFTLTDRGREALRALLVRAGMG
jgi:hypothetical protein